MSSNVSDSPPEGDWRQQARAMAVVTADPSDERFATRTSGALVRRQLIAMLVLTLAILGGMGAYLAGVDSTISLSDTGPQIPFVLIPVVVILVVGVVFMVPMATRGSAEASDAWLKPLGLQIGELPRSVISQNYADSSRPMGRHDLEGSTVMAGTRYGRPVKIVIDVNRYETVVGGGFPGFSVRSTGSGLVAPDNSPPAVAEVIAPLRGKRWQKVEVHSGADGIRVRRKVKSTRAPDALWLSDLWLAERLADRLR